MLFCDAQQLWRTLEVPQRENERVTVSKNIILIIIFGLIKLMISELCALGRVNFYTDYLCMETVPVHAWDWQLNCVSVKTFAPDSICELLLSVRHGLTDLIYGFSHKSSEIKSMLTVLLVHETAINFGNAYLKKQPG